MNDEFYYQQIKRELNGIRHSVVVLCFVQLLAMAVILIVNS